ncbi:MAG: gliding motility-associated C-terminal domain-containing protein [Prolixibacteraceae bacterium]|nr:gliding motility-associated C-terminal domain-containing protein [Prolixibacteraceae bacterium]MBN2649588.1 gliding motility-associated C-terminal domain-containing protein [Prolixibacteraceae bacterium]
MFSKRLSIALCATMCFGTLLFGNNPESSVNTKPVEEENIWMAPEAVDFEAEGVRPKCNTDANGYFTIQIIGTLTDPNDDSFDFVVKDVETGTQVDNGTEYGMSFDTNPILAPGDYEISVTERSSNITMEPKTRKIEVKLPIQITGSSSSPDCSNGQGEITINVSGGNGGYDYYLNYGQPNQLTPTNSTSNSATFTINNSGTYTASVIDSEGCPGSYSGTFNINIPEDINPSVIPGTIDCPGDETTITLNNLPSDASSYQIKLDGNHKTVDRSGTTAIISNVSAGPHILTIERPSCSSDEWKYLSGNPFTIEDYAPVGFYWNVDPNSMSINCFGDDTTAVVTVTGGKTGATVKLSLRNDDVVGGNIRELNPNLNFGIPFTIYNLEANTGYTLIAEDPSGNCNVLKEYPFSISGPDNKFEINGLRPKDVSCNGETDGEIKVTYSNGGSGDIYYSLDEGVTFEGVLPSDNIIKNLEGNRPYYVVLRNDNYCYTESVNATIREPAPIDVTLSVLDDIVCPDGVGKLEAITTGGVSPRYYTLNDSDGNPVSPYDGYQAGDTLRFSNLPSGEYTVEVKGGTCATGDSDIETLSDIPDVNITIAHDPVLCRDEPINNFHVFAIGGDGSKFSFTLKDENGIVAPSVTELAPGDGYTFNGLNPGKKYIVEASYGSCGVVASEDTLITNPPIFNVIYPDTVNLQCYGGDTAITISASGKKPFEISPDGITYNAFSSNDEKHVLPGLTEGNYSYFLRDGNGCLFNDGNPILINVIEPTQINVNVLTSNPKVKCYGEADAEVELEITGGSAPFWVEVIGSGRPVKSTDNNGFVTFMLPAGVDYDLFIEEDGNRCSVTREDVFSVQGPLAPLSFTPIVEEPMLKCYGDSTLVTVDNISGGWPSTYSINIKGGNGVDEDLPPSNSMYLKHGTYYITVSDINNGCIAIDTIEIEQPTKLKLDGLDHSNVSCNGFDDATISFTVSGGTGTYSWGINNVPTNSIIADNFIITNADFNFEIDVPYHLFIGDENGCTVESEEILIQEPEPITFEVQRDSFVSCFGAADGKINIINASGSWDTGYLAWIAPAGGTFEQTNYPVIRDLPAGNYEVKLSNRDETCFSDLVEVKIKEPTPLYFSETEFEITHLRCYNVPTGKLVVKAAGGLPFDLEYRIANGGTYDSGYGDSNVFEDLPSGFYDVWIRIAGNDNCFLQYSVEYGEKIEIENPAELIIDSLVVNNFRCRDDIVRGSVRIVAQGGVGIKHYFLSDAPARITDNPNTTGIFTELGELGQNTTTYHYYVTDENGCQTDEQSFNIINPPKLEISGWEKFDALCHNDRNGSIDLTIVGGTVESDYTITDWLNPGLTYNVEKVTDNNYIINSLGSSNPAGTEYQPVVTDDNGCEVMIETPVLIENPEQVEYEVTIDSALCHGDIDDKIIIHATGGTGNYYYSLDGGNTYGALEDSIFVNEPEGLKKPYVKDENQCVSPNVWPEFQYEEPKPLEVRFTKQGIQCWEDEFGNVVLDITGGTGNYYMSINDKDFGASGSYSNPYEIPRDRRDTTIYDLLDNDIQLPEAQTFAIYLKDKNGCHVQNIEGVNSIQKPVITTTFERPDPLVLLEDPIPYPVTCAGDRTGRIGFKVEGGTFPNFVFTATKQQDPHQYSSQQFNGAVNSSGRGEIEKLYSGIYRCEVTDDHGCQAHTPDLVEIDYVDVEIDAEFDSISVVIYDTIQPVCDSKSNGELHINVLNYMDMGVDVKLEKFNNGSGIFQIHKDDTITYTAEDGDIIFNPEVDFSTYEVHQQLLAERLGIGLYQVIAQDRRSTCTDTVVFNLSSEFGADCPMVSYYNWFSPHSGNLENDEWEIIETEYEDYLLQIYTSYGELVYSDKGNSDIENIKWDGLDDNGMPAPVGTYIYILQKSNGVRDTIINGNVSIIRNVYK